MTKTVALQRCEEYNFDTVYTAIKKLFELVPPPDVKGKTVLLKPNILSPKKPEAAVCTHPVVVGACVRAFCELGAARVLVGESPATANSTAAAKTTGMFDQVVDNGGEWADFSSQVIVPSPDGKLVKSFEFASPFAKADVLVSLSKLKSHQLMSYTGAMKNLFGLVVGLKKAQTHYRFSDKRDFGTYLTDLNIAAKASYAIMDAIVGMEGPGGPGNGDPVNLNFLAASDNILALDWTCASLVGYNPHQVLNLEDALKRKLWLNSPDEIKTVGYPSEQLKSTTFKIVKDASAATKLQEMLPHWLNSLASAVFIKTPRFDAKKCIHCGRCIQICPAHILSFETANSATGTANCAVETASTAHDKTASGAVETASGAAETASGAAETASVAHDNAAQKPKSVSRVVMSDKKKCLHCFCCHEICPVEAINLRHF